MVNKELLDPNSIVIIGGSNDTSKPGGKVLKNIVDGGFKGDIYVVNPKETSVQGFQCYQNAGDLPLVELAIIAIAAKYVPDTVKLLAEEKSTKAFIVISAGFSEESEAGRKLENHLVEIVNQTGASLIGPNVTGVLTPAYHGIFTEPIPKLDPQGCDFITGSGATACFIMENGIPKGLSFARVFSVGNCAQMGVEDILQYMDESYEPGISPRVKLLYMESIEHPDILLKHASSLILKGCRIAAIKAGSSEAGSRAASSHTGALASSDLAVNALFRKAGIIRCYGREELINVASVLMHKDFSGKNIGIITHAGGPAVMLTDALSKEGFNVPTINNPKKEDLLEKLYPGSSVANPIDFLATGTAEHLGTIIDYCDKYFDEIDAMAVIFGTPGLAPIYNEYTVLDEKMKQASKPVFPILPSIFTAKKEVEFFLSKGHINFPDEVLFAQALGKIASSPKPVLNDGPQFSMENGIIRKVIDRAETGYLSPSEIVELLDAAGIPRVQEALAETSADAVNSADRMGYPLVMKVVGPVHKSDVGGVKLNLSDATEVENAFHEMMKIEGATKVLLQPMMKGTEIFAGANYEEKFGHLVLCGLGGIFIEALKDFSYGLAPLNLEEATRMIMELKSLPILKGIRGQKGISIPAFAEVISRLSGLLIAAPEIREMDLNPLMAFGDKIVAVDARIRIQKS